MFSDVDIYITVNDESSVSETNYKWKFKYGTEKVEIIPDDCKFEIGLYEVLLANRDEDEDEYTY